MANLLLALVAATCLQGAAQDVPKGFLPAKPAPNKVLAKVNGAPITFAEMERLAGDWRAWEVVQDLIAYKMLMGEAKKQGLSATSEEVEAELQKQLANYSKNLRQGQTLNQVLRESGFPRSRLWLRVKSQVLLDKIVLKEFNPAEFVDVSTIMIPSKTEQISDLQDAIEQAKKASQDLAAGVSWDTVLKRFQNDPEIVKSHGHLGWRKLAVFPDSIRKDLMTLKEGEATKPAQTNNGIQIFRVDRWGKDAKGEVLKQLREEHVNASRQATLDRIRKAAKVEEFWGK